MEENKAIPLHTKVCGVSLPTRMRKVCGDSSGSGFYILGFIGAAVYYISQATGFWGGVLGFLKAIVWPAFLVYDLLKFMGA